MHQSSSVTPGPCRHNACAASAFPVVCLCQTTAWSMSSFYAKPWDNKHHHRPLPLFSLTWWQYGEDLTFASTLENFNSIAFYNFGYYATKSASRFQFFYKLSLHCHLLCGVSTARGVGRLEATTTPASPTSFAAQSLFSRHQVFCGGPWAFKTSPGLRVLNFARLVRCCRDQLPWRSLYCFHSCGTFLCPFCKFKKRRLLHKTLHDAFHILLVFSSRLQHFSWSIRWWTLLLPFFNSFHQYCCIFLKIYSTHHGANMKKIYI